jgi:hypothetical protein
MFLPHKREERKEGREEMEDTLNASLFAARCWWWRCLPVSGWDRSARRCLPVSEVARLGCRCRGAGGVAGILRGWSSLAEVSHPFNDQMECILLYMPRDQSHIS